MAWGKPPEVDVEEPVNVTEDRIREIVREELAIIAAQGFAAKKLTDDGA